MAFNQTKISGQNDNLADYMGTRKDLSAATTRAGITASER
jgi:hypothetical protein